MASMECSEEVRSAPSEWKSKGCTNASRMMGMFWRIKEAVIKFQVIRTKIV